MKTYVAVALLAFGLIGCTTSERADVRKQARDAEVETRARTADTRRDVTAARTDYENRMQKRLNAINSEMEEERVKASTRQMTPKKQKEYNSRMAELDRDSKDARAKWAEMKGSADENWEKFKDDLDRAADKLESGWNKFVADLKT
jgi:uncharacterized protein YpuA (DUF1002 family)